MSFQVILADDHPLILTAVRNIIEEKFNCIKVVAEAQNATELHSLLRQHPCDILITDLNMPGGRDHDGLSMINKLCRDYPNLPIIVLTQIQNNAILHSLMSLMKSEINAIILKKTVINELSNAIQKILDGQCYIDPALQALQANSIKHLSPKESEVVRLLAGGMSVSQIANHLNRSIKTISSQKKSAMARLGISSDSALFEYIKSSDIS